MGAMAPPGPIVTLLRHGETEWSRTGRHTGVTDVALTAGGEEEARRAAPLVGSGYDLVLTSPRERARRTAELAGLPGAVVDPDLAEWDYGAFEGRTTAEIQAEVPGWTIWDGPWEGGETADDVTARTTRVVGRLLEQPPGARVAVVAHGHLLRALGAAWIRQPAAFGRWLTLGTAAVCRLGWEHEWRTIDRWNVQAG